MNISEILRITTNLMLRILKSFWNATIHITWGIATIFLLGGLMTYFNIDTSSITTLLELCNFIMSNWASFWFVFFVLELLEINKLKTTTKSD